MKFYGKGRQIELEVGKIYHAMKPVINSVWTASFTVVEEGKIYLITYDRDNPIGYDREAEFYLHVKEDDKRNITEIRVSEDSSSHSTRPSDEFEVVNSKYIFSYDGPKTEELKMFPSLKWLATQSVAKKFGLGENGFGYFFHNALVNRDQGCSKTVSEENIFILKIKRFFTC